MRVFFVQVHVVVKPERRAGTRRLERWVSGPSLLDRCLHQFPHPFHVHLQDQVDVRFLSRYIEPVNCGVAARVLSCQLDLDIVRLGLAHDLWLEHHTHRQWVGA